MLTSHIQRFCLCSWKVKISDDRLLRNDFYDEAQQLVKHCTALETFCAYRRFVLLGYGNIFTSQYIIHIVEYLDVLTWNTTLFPFFPLWFFVIFKLAMWNYYNDLSLFWFVNKSLHLFISPSPSSHLVLFYVF